MTARRALIGVALAAPALALAALVAWPQADLTFDDPLAHFYIVTFITFACAVVSILLANALGAQARARHVLAMLAFGVIGTVFFSHGLATPGALIEHAHPAITWSAWLTLFGGGLLFAVAGLERVTRTEADDMPYGLSVRRVALVTLGVTVLYLGIAAFWPDALNATDAYFERTAAPWHRYTIFALTFGLWAFAAFRYWQAWRVTRSRVDGLLAFVAVWMVTATLSMHLTPIWKLSWWVYHMILLVGFSLTAGVLTLEYEQVRQFRLMRYYLALSLIVTALLALAASALFAQFTYSTLTAELDANARATVERVAQGLARDLRAAMPSGAWGALPARAEVDALVAAHLAGAPVERVTLYDAQGVAVYASVPEFTGVKVVNHMGFEAALQGTASVTILPPRERAPAYALTSSTYFIEAFAPLSLSEGGAPSGALSIVQRAPLLNQVLLDTRLKGLLTAGLSMGILFVALLVVVGRADGLITARTEELRALSARLKVYSEWLLGRTLLGQALENPDALGLARRERTILFADVRGFTRWSEPRPPEEVVQMLNRYYSAVEAVVTRHQAIKFKFSADETMAVFADVSEAWAAAQGLRDATEAVLGREGLGVGISLHTGPLVEGLLGSAGVKFYDVIGDTVNTAKRIESAAGRGEVLISEVTRAALGAQVEVVEARTIQAKGKDAPVAVYAVR